MSTLVIKHLTKGFGRGHALAVDDLSFQVADGELLVLLGPSGCGKTTTLRLVAGLETATSGSVAFGDRVVADPSKRIDVPPNKRDLGMVFQSFALWPFKTVRQNIAYPLKVRRVTSNAAEWVTRTAELVDVAHLLDRYPSQLSGGQQQRVALARALVARPALILFDEPLSNLDARLRDQLRTELHRLHREVGFTGVYVTHDQSEALALGDKLAVMRDGCLEQFGTPSEVYEKPHTEYVAGFIGIVNRLLVSRTEGRWTSPFAPLRGAEIDNPGVDEIAIRIREEDLHLANDGSATNGNDLVLEQLTVADVVYAGRNVEVVLRGHDGSSMLTRVGQPGGRGVRPGDVVDVRFSLDDAHAYCDGRRVTLLSAPGVAP